MIAPIDPRCPDGSQFFWKNLSKPADQRSGEASPDPTYCRRARATLVRGELRAYERSVYRGWQRVTALHSVKPRFNGGDESAEFV